MKFTLKKKKKEKDDTDLYEPPDLIGPSSNDIASNARQPFDDHPNPSSEVGSTSTSDYAAGYRFALRAYAETISPALSNEDGLGGGGGTLRSRGGRIKGSAGKKHRSLIPVFEGYPSSGLNETADRYSCEQAYDNLMNPGIFSPPKERNPNDLHSITHTLKNDHWAPIPEEPRTLGTISSDWDNKDEAVPGQEQNIGQSSSEASGSYAIESSRKMQTLSQSDAHIQPQLTSTPHEYMGNPRHILPSTMDPSKRPTINFQNPHVPLPVPSDYVNMNLNQTFIKGNMLKIQNKVNSSSDQLQNRSTPIDIQPTYKLDLQPDAIYEEHYGDAYVDQLMKYLYPTGYQSMRPRSGPWKLSILICILFMWFSVFIVGHCYDRGQQEYKYYFNHADDAYLKEADDDTLVIETRWCGSKLIYFMWMLCVSITMLAMSYCSIIGYIKLRDVAVANGRSQPAGMMNNTAGRSDCYVSIGNVSNGNIEGTNVGNNEFESSSSTSGGYPSYQGGTTTRKYIPSIYQSDGMPQFWGGHIYRPTQAAVALTNR